MTHTPLEMQVHLGNPNKARIKGLTIKPMDECEGGGWYMPADQAGRIVQAVNSFEAMREALKKAEEFITNGIELGYIRMFAPDTPDSAHETLPAIRAALKLTEAK